MAGFDWNQFYTLFKTKMGSVSTVGRYTIPKSPQYPYTDIALSDNNGGHYDLQNHEGSQKPMITVTVYCDNYDDSKCYEVSQKAKEIMLAYGFQCFFQPLKVDNADPTVARWVARYRRTFGAGDTLRNLY
ncbi:MAG: hypothetical protein K6G30_00605 [Acetatifactor sp.]|nr:hypothetical protein [Acetatifactor sp.]